MPDTLLGRIIVNSIRDYFAGDQIDVDGGTVEVVPVPGGVEIRLRATDANGESTDQVLEWHTVTHRQTGTGK